MSETIRGKVKFFNQEKGFGFIQPEGGGDDVFVHITAIRESHFDKLDEGDEVEFVKTEGRNGKFQAENIKITN